MSRTGGKSDRANASQSTRADLHELLQQSGSPDVFIQELLGFLSEILADQPDHPMARALVHQLQQGATLDTAAAILHDARSMLQVLTTVTDVAYGDAVGLLADLETGFDARRLALEVQEIVASLDDLNAATETLAEIVDDGMVIYGRASPGPAPVSLIATVKVAMRLFSRMDRRRAPKAEQLPDVSVRAPHAHVVRVLLNLLINAADAIVQKPDGAIGITGWATEHYAFVQVSDNGPGIHVSLRNHIFQPFFTTKPRGTGIGLHACRLLVEDWGGQIEVDSNTAFGRGTRFTISIPRAE